MLGNDPEGEKFPGFSRPGIPGGVDPGLNNGVSEVLERLHAAGLRNHSQKNRFLLLASSNVYVEQHL